MSLLFFFSLRTFFAGFLAATTFPDIAWEIRYNDAISSRLPVISSPYSLLASGKIENQARDKRKITGWFMVPNFHGLFWYLSFVSCLCSIVEKSTEKCLRPQKNIVDTMTLYCLALQLLAYAVKSKMNRRKYKLIVHMCDTYLSFWSSG